MHPIPILVAAAAVGIAGGYAWSLMSPAVAHAPVASSPSRPRHEEAAKVAKPSPVHAPQVVMTTADDRAWLARARQPLAPPAPTPAEALRIEQSVYYRSCAEARAAGAAPIARGQPGYRDALDADGDGIACEPYRGND